MKRNILVFSLALLLAACGGGGGGGSVTGGTSNVPVIADNTTSTTYASTSTGRTYPVNVYVPSNYGTTTDMLPVFFLLDGDLGSGGNFDIMRRIMLDESTHAILIGIGTADRRDYDFLQPGSPDYYKFLTNELVPAMGRQYRVDVKNRVLVGHSYGADFVQTAFTLDRPDRRFFTSFVAIDGPLRDPVEFGVLENTLFQASGGKIPDTTFIFASAAGAGFNTDVEAAYQKMLSRNYQGLNIVRLPAYPTDHSGVFQPAITDVLHMMFKK